MRGRFEQTMTPEERFWSKVDKSGGCWIWTSSINAKGYGEFRLDKRTQKAHRVAYRFARGPIPLGLTLDHLCRTRACVNPNHLEPVTAAENTRRGQGFSAVNARRTHCANGHEYTEANTYMHLGRNRQCRTCHNARGRKLRAIAEATNS